MMLFIAPFIITVIWSLLKKESLKEFLARLVFVYVFGFVIGQFNS